MSTLAWLGFCAAAFAAGWWLRGRQADREVMPLLTKASALVDEAIVLIDRVQERQP